VYDLETQQAVTVYLEADDNGDNDNYFSDI
jgi:hypothetical protein